MCRHDNEFHVPVGTHETYATTYPMLSDATKLVAPADLMRPCRDALSNDTPKTGATGPRLFSWGPPGPEASLNSGEFSCIDADRYQGREPSGT